MAELRVRLTPRARRTGIGPERDGALIVRVSAPPVDGQANAALCRLLAEHAGVPRRAVTIVRGESSREKLLRIDGLTDAELRARLAAAGSSMRA